MTRPERYMQLRAGIHILRGLGKFSVLSRTDQERLKEMTHERTEIGRMMGFSEKRALKRMLEEDA